MTRILVLYNPLPHAAREALLAQLYEALAATEFEVHSLATAASLSDTQQALDKLTMMPDRVIVVGGDGTLHQAVNLFHRDSIALGYVPAGTGNDFARHWLGSMNARFCIQVAIYGEPEAIDLGYVEGKGVPTRFFINSVGVGFDGALIQNLPDKIPYFPKVSYLWRAIKMLFRYRGKPIELDEGIILSGDAKDTPVFMLVIANGPYYGAGMKIAPHALLDDEQLSYVCIKECRLLTKLSSIASIYSGCHLRKRMVTHGHLRSLEIKTAAIPMQVDGEYLGQTPARFKSVSGAIRIARTLRN